MEKQYYKEYYFLERQHWWFKERIEILENLLIKKIKKDFPKPYKILNTGVATGATSEMLEKFGEVISLEFDKDCCDFLISNLNIKAINASITDMPFPDESFDLVCAFDVIEHVEDDHAALREIKRVLKPDGVLFVTVPAFNYLWSQHDVVNHHFRRYTMTSMAALIKEGGLKSVFRSYFNFFLFPPIFAIRTLSKLLPHSPKKDTAGSDFDFLKGRPAVNNIFYRIFKIEKRLLPKIRLPFGVSLIFIAKK
jgi:SAM-dependent methyltransferase